MSRLAPNMHKALSQEKINILFDKRIYTVLNFIQEDSKNLAALLDLSYQDIIEIRNHLINKNSGVVRKASDFYFQSLNNSAILSTGVSNIDNLLGGGLRTGKIYEVCGLPNSAKTQYCLTILKNVTLRLEQNVFYLDTKRDFSAKRLKGMIKDSNDVAAVMERSLISRVNTLQELINILYSIKENTKSYNARIIIIDSLPTLLYLYSDNNQRFLHLSYAVNIMRVLCNVYNFVILVVNVETFYKKSFHEDEYQQLLGSGKCWQSIPNVRIKFEKRLVDYEVSILKSTYLDPSKKTYIKVTELGVEDV